MSTIVTRYGKGSPLTWLEVDDNFTNLNTDKIQSGNTVAALTITSATINGGTITGITDLAVADGGTGLSTLTAGYIPFGAGTSAFGSSANLFWDSTNNRLGIGTAAPVSSLNIYNATSSLALISSETLANIISAKYSTNDAAPFMTLRKGRGTVASPTAIASGDTLGQLLFQGYGGTNNRNLSAISGFVSTYTSDSNISSILTFGTSPSGSAVATERMRITSAGDVGIGRTSPYNLSNYTALSIGRSSTTQGMLYLSNGTTNYWSYANSSGAFTGTSSNHSYIIQTNGSEKMRIDSSGNVAIGTTVGASYAGYTTLTINNATNGGYLSLAQGGTEIANFFSTGTTTYLTSVSAIPLVFQTNNTERMRIDSAGNVGIGTTSPSTYGRLAILLGNAASTITNGIAMQAGSAADASSLRISGYGYAGRQQTAIDFLQNSGTNWNSQIVFSTDTGSSLTEKMRIDSAGAVGIGTTTPLQKLTVWGTGTLPSAIANTQLLVGDTSGFANAGIALVTNAGNASSVTFGSTASPTLGRIEYDNTNNYMRFYTNSAERMRITNEGRLLIGKTAVNFSVAGGIYNPSGSAELTVDGGTCLAVNRLTNDGTLVSFSQAGTEEGTISVSGTTVSYNGGHLSRWSQFYNETTKVAVYRGTVLESVDAMCEWEKDGEPLPNEQATKTIVSTTLASKAVAGVFDRYDEDDETNPYDFYVAQSGDFVIRIAQGVTVQNGDLLESAGDGTAKPQADDICRSSTIAKVTSNYVSATYEDGSYCVPCILMIG